MILALFAACAPPVPPAAPAELAPASLDFGPLYGGLSSGSVVSRTLVEPGLLARVRVEPGTLALFREDTGVEGWTRGVLLGGLGSLGSVVVGPDWPSSDDDPDRVPAEASAWLRELRFAPGTEPVAVVVSPGDETGRIALSIRSDDEEASLCPPGLELDLDYIELHGVLQRASDRAVVAVWQEVGILEVEGALLLAADLPDPDTHPDAFCAGVAVAHREVIRPAISGSDYDRTAERLLTLALQQLTSSEVDLPGLVRPPEPVAPSD